MRIRVEDIREEKSQRLRELPEELKSQIKTQAKRVSSNQGHHPIYEDNLLRR